MLRFHDSILEVRRKNNYEKSFRILKNNVIPIKLYAIKRTEMRKYILYYHLQQNMSIKRQLVLDIQNPHSYLFNQAIGWWVKIKMHLACPLLF